MALLAWLCLASLCAVVCGQYPFDTVLRIDCGGYSNFTSKFNLSWMSDRFFTGGAPGLVSEPHNFEQEQERTLRFFPIAMGKKNCYIVKVPDGRYYIRTFFVYDNYDSRKHSPSFEVSVEGTLVFSWRSPWLEENAKFGAYSDLFAFVKDGEATVCLYSIATDAPVIGSLEIIQVDPLSYASPSIGKDVILVNYGRLTCGSASFGPGFSNDTDNFGRAWQSDMNLVISHNGRKVLSTQNLIKSTNQAHDYFPVHLYQTAHTLISSGELEYHLSVDTRLDYMLWFHFAEIDSSITTAGQRVFDIIINDINLHRIDIFKEVGSFTAFRWQHIAHNLTKPTISIKLVPVTGTPIISGLENYALIPMDLATETSEVVAMRALKESFQIPDRMGWNGDPCAPSTWDAWEGVTCNYNKDSSALVITHLLIGNAVERAKAFVEEQKQEWTKFGCTILSDGWTDGKSRTIINFLACCNDNVVFLKSIDASNKVKNAQTLALMLENMVLEIGIENVVQIITDNAAAYVSAGKLLQQRHPTLSWTPCAAHVLDLLLEDMGKLDWVTPIVEDARRVTKYIYNHPWVLSLMREHTDGKEIVRPAVTRFATIFLTLQSILDNLASLKQMFVSKKWLASTFSKKSEGANVLRIVFDKYFEDKANEIVKVSEPLVGVLRLVDGDQTPMGELYEAMDKAKESVKNYYKGESIKYEPIWQIIDRRWNNQLHQPIHAAGYFLNPRFRADGTYADPDGEVIRGLSECVEKMVTSEETRDKIIAEQEIFTSAGGKVFSTSLCKRARLTQTPVAWWTTWGASTPNLAKFALRILSQPCSASHCERNWSLFEAIHTKKRNRLSQKRMNDMVYVQYNLKLRMKKAQQDPPGPIDLDEIDPYYDWTAQERAPLFTQEDISNLEREAAEEAAEEEGGGTGYDIDLDDIEEGDDEDDDIELTAEDLDILRAANVELPTSSSIATPSPALAQTQTRAQTLRGSSSRALPSPALASKATGKRKM